ncbi:MAG: amidohydrolase family protein [Victivallales bacterium]|nr:amidohydrolase family protein [Victivallales bacterium]
MRELSFFDVCCRVGDTPERPFPDIPGLLVDMDKFGVDRALVQHNALGTMGAENTNAALVEMLKEQDPEKRLECAWCILPSQCGELPEPEAFFCAMRENRVRAITLDPFSHRFIPCRLTVGKYLDEAVRRRIPVLLNSFAGKWAELYAFLREFPDLLCIIHGGDKWGCDRFFRPLLEAYPGVRLELSGYWVPEGIADLAGVYGAERLLYGSGFPRYNQGSSMLQLKYCGLDERDIALIAGKNLENMLEESSC